MVALSALVIGCGPENAIQEPGVAQIYLGSFTTNSEPLACTVARTAQNSVQLIIGSGQMRSTVNAVVEFESDAMNSVRTLVITKDDMIPVAKGSRTTRYTREFSIEFYAQYDIAAGWTRPTVSRRGTTFEITGKSKFAAPHQGGRNAYSDPNSPIVPTYKISASCVDKR
ncbi:hypothetical protein SMNI109538_05430 [Smaragdicoccus niigatensis]